MPRGRVSSLWSAAWWGNCVAWLAASAAETSSSSLFVHRSSVSTVTNSGVSEPGGYLHEMRSSVCERVVESMPLSPTSGVFMLAAFSFVALVCPQEVEVPAKPDQVLRSSLGSGNRGVAQQFVDFHDELDHRGFVAVVGTLDKTRDGKRRRLPEGKLTSGGGSVSVSGTQYFEVPVRASLRVRAILAGELKSKSKVKFDLRVQLARLPSGEERRQTMDGNAAEFEPGMLGLWVLAAADKGRGMQLRHVIPFDPKVGGEIYDEGKFVDAMADFVTINKRVARLEQGLQAFDAAVEAADRVKARAGLSALLEEDIELRRPELDGLLQSRCGPWEDRARKRLEAAPGAAPPADKRG